MKAKRNTVLVKRGNVTVRIYPYLKNGAPYYHVADYSSGKRVFRGFSELTKAKTEAALIATRMNTGDHDELERVERLIPDNGEIEIYTPEEIIRLIKAADKDFLPSLLLGGFAGLRSSEIERLDWREVHLAERFIEIKKKKTKTASRRLISIVDNLAEWLAPFAKQNGLVWPHGHDAFYDAEQATAKATQVEANPGKGIAAQAPLKWRQNALRHSFISYRLAVLQNENQVAMESGNSPVMIHKHYKQLVSPAMGAKWFGIRPHSRLA